MDGVLEDGSALTCVACEDPIFEKRHPVMLTGSQDDDLEVNFCSLDCMQGYIGFLSCQIDGQVPDDYAFPYPAELLALRNHNRSYETCSGPKIKTTVRKEQQEEEM